MSDDLLKRADNCGTIPSIFLVRDLAARVRELEAERSAMIDNVRFARERAERAEAERDNEANESARRLRLIAELRAERDALRALLVEAKMFAETTSQWTDFVARIDAALGEKP